MDKDEDRILSSCKTLKNAYLNKILACSQKSHWNSIIVIALIGYCTEIDLNLLRDLFSSCISKISLKMSIKSVKGHVLFCII